MRWVSSRATSLPLCSCRRLLPTVAAVASAWALLPSSSTGCCVRYSLLVCCCCAPLLLLRSSYFSAIPPPGTTPPPYAARFPDISFSFRQIPDCSNILIFRSPLQGNLRVYQYHRVPPPRGGGWGGVETDGSPSSGFPCLPLPPPLPLPAIVRG